MANYLTPNEKRRTLTSSKKKTKNRLSLPIVLFTIFAILAGSIASLFISSTQVEKTQAWDPVRDVVCSFEEGSVPRFIYDATQANEIQFSLFSKSPVTGGGLAVDSGLNGILSISGMDFAKTNEMVVGVPMDRTGQTVSSEPTEPKTEEELAEGFNKGPKVSVFDRFGMAGTVYTSYNGEWRYLSVDPCVADSAKDLRLGVFYDDRLEPRSTWEDRDGSEDPRTQQHAYGWNTQFWKGFLNLSANMALGVTKAIVTFTVAFINFSFADLTNIFGLDTILAGDDNQDGLFQQLHEGLYVPLIVIIMALTGVRVVWVGLAKRQFMNALKSALVSVLMFMLALVVFAAPNLFVKLPNAAAVTIQSVIIGAFSSGLAGGDGLCTTNVGAKTIDENTGGLTDQDLLTQVSSNLQSNIGCTFWQTFVFIPWVEGQWGTDYNELWAKGFAPEGGKALANDNEEMVGNAAVPLGDGQFIHNWAVFQISAQTEAHAPLGHDGNYSKVTNNVTNDWWRIVDAVSNYNEKTNTQMSASAVGDNEEFDYIVPDTSKKPLVYWDDWVGNNGWSRIGAAATSMVVGGIGMAAPLVFAFLTALFGIATAIVMAFAPLALLFGAWGTRGFNFFKNWGLLVFSLFMKRIAASIILMFSIVFTNAAIVLMRDVNWWSGISLMAVIAIVLIMSKDRIMNALTSVGVGAGSFAGTAKALGDKVTKTTKTAGKIVSSGTSGAVMSKAKGGDLATGFKTGAGQELRNLAYQNPLLMSARRELEAQQLETGEKKAHEITEGQICRICMRPLASRDENGKTMEIMLGSGGNYIHQDCYYADEDLVATEFPDETFRELSLAESMDSSFDYQREKRAREKSSEINENYAESLAGLEKNMKYSKLKDPLDAVADLVKIASDTVTHELRPEITDAIRRLKDPKDKSVTKIQVPQALADKNYMDQSLIDAAVRDNKFDYIEASFAIAFALHVSDVVAEETGKNLTFEIMENVQSELQEVTSEDTRVDTSIAEERETSRVSRRLNRGY